MEPDAKIQAPDTVSTADGTITCRDQQTGELYHNSGGAYREAVEGYSQPACLHRLFRDERPTTLRLLDICFGMGYNSFAMVNEIIKHGHPFHNIEIEAVEMDFGILQHFPSVIDQACFAELRDSGITRAWAQELVASPQESLVAKVELTGLKQGRITLSIRLHLGDLRTIVPQLAVDATAPGRKFDFIFHDPFSPNKVPELWTHDLFYCYRKLIKDDGRFLTYSAASAVRAGLIEAGFDVFRTKGVGFKAGGGTLAVPTRSDLNSATRDGVGVLVDDLIFLLEDEESSRLTGRPGVPYRDKEFCSTRREVLQRRAKEQDALTAPTEIV
jgi:chorismate dehydratase